MKGSQHIELVESAGHLDFRKGPHGWKPGHEPPNRLVYNELWSTTGSQHIEPLESTIYPDEAIRISITGVRHKSEGSNDFVDSGPCLCVPYT